MKRVIVILALVAAAMLLWLVAQGGEEMEALAGSEGLDDLDGNDVADSEEE